MKSTDYYLLLFLSLTFLSLFLILTNFLRFKFGLDIAGGIILYYDADISKIKQEEIKDILDAVKDLIERRINFLGISEINITYTSKGRMIMEIPNITDLQKTIEIIGKTPVLEFKIPQNIATQTFFIPSQLTGRYLKTAEVVIDNRTGFPVVEVIFDKEGAQIFEELTKKYINQPLGIYLDDQLISTPIVKEVIKGGRAIIEGNFNLAEAKELATRLKQGALPVPLKLVGYSVVHPFLGEKFFNLIIQAGIIGSLLVALLMILYYQIHGIIAILALIFYLVFNIALYKILGITLSLASITGFILSIGMAIDANILIGEEIREMKKKLIIKEAIINGFKKAWLPIRDSNVSTIISVLLMYFLGTSFVRGFSLTLGLGVIISILTAFLLTKFLTYKIFKIDY